MGTLFYSMAGEGRGHATRVRSLVEPLRSQHRIVLFASGDAYDFLQTMYHGTEVELHQIPGLRFHYTSKHKLSYFKTTCETLRYLWNLSSIVRSLEKRIREEQPDLVITDFEPALARAARRAGVPFLSVDHQHFLAVSDFSELPWWMRNIAWMEGELVKLYYSGEREMVISSFYFPPLKPTCRNVIQVGVMLRSEIENATPQMGDHLLAYFRRDGYDGVLDTLKSSPHPVKVYGLGERPAEGKLEFCPISEQQFIDDLSSCMAVVTNGGNQLVGESLWLEKPVLSMPEDNNFEQLVNAFYLHKSETGMSCAVSKFNSSVLQEFLDCLDDYRANIDRDRMNGNVPTLKIIRRHLEQGPALITESQKFHTPKEVLAS